MKTNVQKTWSVRQFGTLRSCIQKISIVWLKRWRRWCSGGRWRSCARSQERQCRFKRGSRASKQTNTGHHLLNLPPEPNLRNRGHNSALKLPDSAKRIRTSSSSSMHCACPHFISPRMVCSGCSRGTCCHCEPIRTTARQCSTHDREKKVHFAKEKRERSHNWLGIAGHRTRRRPSSTRRSATRERQTERSNKQQKHELTLWMQKT